MANSSVGREHLHEIIPFMSVPWTPPCADSLGVRPALGLFHMVFTDSAEPLPVTKTGHKYIPLAMANQHLTGWPTIQAV